METVISDLVERFERGKLSRRQLIGGLTALAGTAAATRAGAQQTPFSSTRIDHVSIQVTDLPRSIAFYRDVFGLEILNEDVENRIVRMGTTQRNRPASSITSRSRSRISIRKPLPGRCSRSTA